MRWPRVLPRVLSAVALGCVVGAGVDRGAAQQQREPIAVRFQLTPAGDGVHTQVVVRLYNVSSHTVNLWMPSALWCGSAPGAVSLEWRYRATDSLGIEQTRVDSSCGNALVNGASGELTERVAKQKREWRALGPGQYAEVSDSINTADVAGAPGEYGVRAVYTSPAFSGDGKRQLRDIGIETPSGVYRSETIKFAVR